MTDLQRWLAGRDLHRMDHPQVAADEAWALVRSGLPAQVPLPGSGHTLQRWQALAELGRADLTLSKIVEGHLDAVAILAELGGADLAGADLAGPDQLWGTWAADPPRDPLRAAVDGTGQWLLSGVKPWCSGAAACSHALVTAHAEDGYRLFAVDLAHAGVGPVPGSWPSLPMSGTDSRTMTFDGVPAAAVGGPGAYLARPGFSHGGIGVAAVWLGGVTGIVDTVTAAGRRLDPHALAHLGALDAGLFAARATLAETARIIDAEPLAVGSRMNVLMLAARTVVTQLATEAMERSARALGPGPFATDRAAGRRVAELWLFIRQGHAERDLEWLGSLSLDTRDEASSW